MPGQKISSLSPVSDLQAADQLVLARSGSTYKITGDKFASKAQLDSLSATSDTKFALKTNLDNLSATPFIAADTSTIDLNLTSRTLSASLVDSSITNSKLAFDGGSFAFRNKIINGNFGIWQRGTSLASGTGGRYLADRFTNGSTGTTCTAAQSAFALGQTGVPNEPDYYISTAVTSVAGASNNATLHQHIESVKSCAGKTVTLSFYAKSNASRNIAVELYQNFGTGGTPSTSVSIPAGLVALTTSWQKFTVTVNIPSISGKVLGTAGNDSLVAYFWFDAGSSNSSRASSLGQQSGTFDIAQVQLEEGSVATPFELRPIGTELSLCQRYYTKSFDLSTKPQANIAPGYLGIDEVINPPSGNIHGARMLFPVRMRSTPVVTFYNPFANTSLNTIYISEDNDNTASISSYDAGETGVSAVELAGISWSGTEPILGRRVAFWQYTANAEL